MSLRLIEGGCPEGVRPIVWNRLPIDAQRVALVVRNAEGSRDRLDLAWDDGRPWLVGIRSMEPSNTVALDMWKLHAKLCGAEVRDERDPFAEADEANARLARLAALEREQRERAARRRADPMPEGGLFDEVRRTTRDLF